MNYLLYLKVMIIDFLIPLVRNHRFYIFESPSDENQKDFCSYEERLNLKTK
jgi:hypothetical protein